MSGEEGGGGGEGWRERENARICESARTCGHIDAFAWQDTSARARAYVRR